MLISLLDVKLDISKHTVGNIDKIFIAHNFGSIIYFVLNYLSINYKMSKKHKRRLVFIK